MGSHRMVDTVAQYRNRAEELRTLATEMRDLASRATMFSLADQYDQMARTWENTHEVVRVNGLAMAG